MSGKIISRINPDTWDLVVENREVFDPVVVAGEKAGADLRPRTESPGFHTETELLENGDLQVSLFLPMDDDSDPTNGRLYLEDRFTFDPKDDSLKNFKRDFFYNGRFKKPRDREKWQAWREKYRSAEPLKKEILEKYAREVGLSYPRPITSKIQQALADVQKPIQKTNYFNSLLETLSQEGLWIQGNDPRNHYTVREKGDLTEVTLCLVVQNPEKEHSGYLFLQDRFTFLTHAPETPIAFQRELKPGFAGPEGERMDTLAQSFYQVEENKAGEKQRVFRKDLMPSLDEAKLFITPLKHLLLQKTPDFQTIAEDKRLPPAEGYQALNFGKFLEKMTDSMEGDAPEDFDPEFAKILPLAVGYFEPLREAIADIFPLDLKNLPLKISVDEQNGKTAVHFRYTFADPALDGRPRGKLSFTESYFFEGNELKEVKHLVRMDGPDPEGRLEKGRARLQEKVDQGGFFAAGDSAAQQFSHFFIPYLVPQLKSFGDSQPRLLDAADLPGELRSRLETLDGLNRSLVPYLHQQSTDPGFRVALLHALNKIQFGDMEGALKTLGDISESTQAVLKNAGDQDSQSIYLDHLKVADVVLAVVLGYGEQALKEAAQIQHVPLRKIFLQVLEPVERKKSVREGMEILFHVAQEQLAVTEHESHAWIGGKNFDERAMAAALRGLFAKAATPSSGNAAKSPFQILKGLNGLGAREEALREKILLDPAMQKINAVAQGLDKEEQAREYFQVARRDLLARKLAGSAQWLATRMAIHHLPMTPALEGVEILAKVSEERLQADQEQEVARAAEKKTGEVQAYLLLEDELAGLQQEIKSQTGNELSREKVRSLHLEFLKSKVKEQTGKEPSPEELQQILVRQAQAQIKEKLGIELSEADVARIQKEGDKAFGPLVRQVEAQLAVDPTYQQGQEYLATSFGLFKKAQEAAQNDPDLPARQILKTLTGLNSEELKVRESMLENPALEKFFAVNEQEDGEGRIQAYQSLFQAYSKDKALGAAVNSLSQQLQQNEWPASRALEGILLPFYLQTQLAEGRVDEIKKKNIAEGLQGTLAPEILKTFPLKDRAREGLWERARNLAALHPSASPLALLKELSDDRLDKEFEDFKASFPERNEEEKKKISQQMDLIKEMKAQRDAILKDKFSKKIAVLTQETNPVKRKADYEKFFAAQSFQKEKLMASGFWFAQMLRLERLAKVSPRDEVKYNPEIPEEEKQNYLAQVPEPSLPNDLHKFLGNLEGTGDFGTKVEYALPHFTEEATKPTTLAAMFFAGLTGPVAETGALGLLRWAGASEKIFSRARIAAGAFGAGVEGLSFTTAQKVGESAFYSSQGQWDRGRFWKDAGNAALLFGALRLGHAATGLFSEHILATGRLGKWAGGYVYGQPGRAAVTTPLGSIRPMTKVGAGGLVPQLTVAGSRVTDLLQHVSGVGAMFGTGYVGRDLGWAPQSKAGWQGHLADSFLMYAQAIFGFRCANALTGGKFQNALAGLKLLADYQGIQSQGDFSGLPEKGMLQLFEMPGPKPRPKPESKPKPKTEPSALRFPENPEALKLQLEEILGESIAKQIQIKKVDNEYQLRDNRTVIVKGHELFRNGSTVPPGKWVEFGREDIFSYGEPTEPTTELGEEYRSTPILPDVHPLTFILSKVPREEQLSLARSVAGAKTFEKLGKRLERSSNEAGVSLLGLLQSVLGGKTASLSDLPEALGFRAKVKQLMENEVRGLQQEGYLEGKFELSSDLHNESWSGLESAFHKGRLAKSFRQSVAKAGNLEQLHLVLQMVPFAKIDGIPIHKIRGSLQAKIYERELRENKDLPEERIKGLTEDVQVAKQELGENFELPQTLGLRQKARDLEEAEEYQRKSAAGEALSEYPDKEVVLGIVRKRLDPRVGDNFLEAQKTIRSAIDSMSFPAKTLLLKYSGEKLSSILKTYFGPSGRRELPSEQRAFEIATFLGRAGSSQKVQLVYEHPMGKGIRPVLVLGESGEGIPLVTVHNDGFGPTVMLRPRNGVLDRLINEAMEHFSFLEDTHGKPSPHWERAKDSEDWYFRILSFHPAGAAEFVLRVNPQAEGMTSWVKEMKVRYALKKNSDLKTPEFQKALQQLQEDIVWKSKLKIENIPWNRFATGIHLNSAVPTWGQKAVSLIPEIPSRGKDTSWGKKRFSSSPSAGEPESTPATSSTSPAFGEESIPTMVSGKDVSSEEANSGHTPQAPGSETLGEEIIPSAELAPAPPQWSTRPSSDSAEAKEEVPVDSTRQGIFPPSEVPSEPIPLPAEKAIPPFPATELAPTHQSPQGTADASETPVPARGEVVRPKEEDFPQAEEISSDYLEPLELDEEMDRETPVSDPELDISIHDRLTDPGANAVPSSANPTDQYRQQLPTLPMDGTNLQEVMSQAFGGVPGDPTENDGTPQRRHTPRHFPAPPPPAIHENVGSPQTLRGGIVARETGKMSQKKFLEIYGAEASRIRRMYLNATEIDPFEGVTPVLSPDGSTLIGIEKEGVRLELSEYLEDLTDEIVSKETQRLEAPPQTLRVDPADLEFLKSQAQHLASSELSRAVLNKKEGFEEGDQISINLGGYEISGSQTYEDFVVNLRFDLNPQFQAAFLSGEIIEDLKNARDMATDPRLKAMYQAIISLEGIGFHVSVLKKSK